MYTINKSDNSQKAFTLIELLVVIFILASLFMLIMPNLTGARERAQDANAKQSLNAIKGGLGLYFADYQVYPTAAPGYGIDSTFFTKYMPDANAGIGITYTYTTTGSTFLIGTTLLGTYGDDDTNSSARCGVTQSEGSYYVCGR